MKKLALGTLGVLGLLGSLTGCIAELGEEGEGDVTVRTEAAGPPGADDARN